jgi:hypothetical protein
VAAFKNFYENTNEYSSLKFRGGVSCYPLVAVLGLSGVVYQNIPH